MSTPQSTLTSTLWRDTSYVLYWLGRTISIAGSTITGVVMPILVFQLTGSALQTSLLASLQVIPYLLFGLFAGAVSDRANRRRMMVSFDLLNALLLATIPVAAALDVLTLTQIYVVALLSAFAFVWFDAANFGALPTLVGQKHIVEANSNIWATSTIISIIGPAVGGYLATTIGASFTLSLDAISYILSAVCLGFVPRAMSLAPPNRTAVATSPYRQAMADIREGIAFIWQQRLVRALTLLGFGVSLTGGAVTGLLVVFAVEGLGLGQDDGRIGLLYTAGAVGALLSSLLLPRLVKRFPIGWITLANMFGALVLLIIFALNYHFVLGLILYLAWNVCYVLVLINGISLRQVVTPSHLQGRVNVTARMIAWGGTPFGAALGGVLAEYLDIRAAYLIMAMGIGLSLLIGWFSPLRDKESRQII